MHARTKVNSRRVNADAADRVGPEAGSASEEAVAICNEADASRLRLRSASTAAAPSGVAGKTVLARVAMLLALLGVLLWSYWPTLSDLVAFWQQNSDYSAGALVPLVAAYMIWADRKHLQSLPATTCWEGLVVLLATQALRFYGLLYMYGSLERLSFLLTIVGACLLVLGRQMTWRMAPVLAFLALMFPLPHRVHNMVALPLQTFASASAVAGLEMLGYLVTQEGNILRLSDKTTVAVAEACSGLRMLTAFVVVAAALAFVVNRPRWQKAVVLASSVPVAILANTVRLIVTVQLFEHVGSKTGEKFFHDFAGLAMIPFAWAVLMVELWLLRWMTGDAAANPASKKSRSKLGRSGPSIARCAAEPAATSQWLAFGRPAVICTMVVILVAGLGHRLLAGRIDVALGQSLVLREPLSTLPLQIGDWQGRDIPLDENTRRIAGDDDSINRQYVNEKTGHVVGVYIGYMGRPRSRMGHRPDVCYPAHGFQEKSRIPVSVAGPDGVQVPALLYEFTGPQPGGPRDLVLATYIINGRYVNDVAAANDVNTRGAGLSGKREAYVARIQASVRATGDQATDMAALSGLASRLYESANAMMPDLQESRFRGQQ